MKINCKIPCQDGTTLTVDFTVCCGYIVETYDHGCLFSFIDCLGRHVKIESFSHPSLFQDLLLHKVDEIDCIGFAKCSLFRPDPELLL